MDYFPILELPEEIQALVVERVAERSSVNHFYYVLSVPRRLNMSSEFG
uniref:Uncharacterized protein n=1 Tax=Brassica oleracea TaxID=3712 RepID=A0A3P6CA05_BRAOL|nr:unnamed protein product [Brassica oleracea]